MRNPIEIAVSYKRSYESAVRWSKQFRDSDFKDFQIVIDTLRTGLVIDKKHPVSGGNLVGRDRVSSIGSSGRMISHEFSCELEAVIEDRIKDLVDEALKNMSARSREYMKDARIELERIENEVIDQ